MSRISFVNGEYVEHSNAKVHVEDRGYVFSDGVYEVAYIKNGVLIDWTEHCVRLQRSVDGIRIDYKVSEKELGGIVQKLLEKNSLDHASVYLQISRGVAPRLHHFPKPAVAPSVIMTVSPAKLPSSEQKENGVKAITTPDLRWKRRDLKTISLLPNTLAKQEAFEAGAEEAILFEDDGKVTEGSSTNVFIVQGATLRTHPANESILGGITRDGILKVAKAGGVKIEQVAFSKDELMKADEVFISSTTKHVLPVTEIDGKKIGNGKVGTITKNLMKLYEEYIEKQL